MKNQRRGGIHLTLVQEPGADTHNRGIVVATDSLARSDAERIRFLVSRMGIGGVLTGVVHGAFPGDLHPLVLQGARLYVVRFLPSEILNDPVLFHEISLMLVRWQSYKLDMEAGEVKESALWFLRPFYGKLLQELASPLDMRIAVGQLVDAVETIHRTGLVHGHITPSNVAIVEGQLSLLDPLVGWFSSSERMSQQGFISDSTSRALPSRRDDLFGVGLCIEHMVRAGGECSDGQREVLAALLSGSEAKRIELPDVRDAWSRQETFGATSEVQRGRLIGAGRSPLPNLTERVPLISPQSVISTQPISSADGVVSPSQLSIAPSGVAARTGNNPYTGALMALVVAVVAYFGWQYLRGIEVQKEQIPAHAYWHSGRVELMTEVARAAVANPDSEARDVVIGGAFRGDKVNFVRSDLIRRAFNPLWSESIDEDNKRFVLVLALGPLLPKELRDLPLPPNLHPGVVFAALASSPLGSATIAVEPKVLAQLPKPYGEIITRTVELAAAEGMDPIGRDELIRAVCHLLVGDSSSAVLETMLPQSMKGDAQDKRLALLRELIRVPEVARHSDDLTSHFQSRFQAASEVTKWFSGESPVSWAGVAPEDRLELLLGDIPDSTSSESHLVDLLSFPVSRVRALAVLRLSTNSEFASLSELLQQLAGFSGGLSRDQVFTLLGTLRMEGAARGEFVAKWFQTKPSARAVVLLLASYQPKVDADPFLIGGANYVLSALRNGTRIELKDGVLSSLVGSPEPLVRGIAYLLLQPKISSHRKILQGALQKEIVPRLKNQLAELLNE